MQNPRNRGQHGCVDTSEENTHTHTHTHMKACNQFKDVQTKFDKI